MIKSGVECITDHILNTFQFGFRKWRSTLQSVWGFREISQDTSKSREELMMIFIDVVKAFDSAQREAIIRSLKSFVVEKHFRSLILQIQENAHGELDSEKRLKIERRVRKWCVIASQLFSLKFERTRRWASSTGKNWAVSGDQTI